jgi:PAS domain S-box-containing protein
MADHYAANPQPDVAELEDLFENAPCGYVSADADGTVGKANRTLADWLGIPASAIVGRRFHDLLTIPGKIYYETHFAPLLRMQGFFHEVALDMVCADGSRLPVLVNAVERRGEQGELRFTRITVFNASDRRRYEQELLQARRGAEQISAELRDLNVNLEARVAREVGERLAAEQALRQAQKLDAVGQLTGGVAHDFNNMLAVVLGGLNLIKRRIERGNIQIEDLVDTVTNSVHKAAVLTQRLLAFSRMQPLTPAPLNVNKMVSEMSELLRSTLGEAVRIEAVLAAGLWLTIADQSQLENAIVNLAVNGRDAMPEGGRLTIETANAHIDDDYARIHAVPAGQYVMVAVSDSGAGMDEAVIAKAFDPFFTTKGVGKGTGLGLSQVFGFVKQSGGHVKIYSEIGQGTAVKIYLPRYYGPVASVEPKTQLATAQGGTGELILLVEDDDGVRDLTARMLRDLGYDVIVAADGVKALAAFDANPSIQLILTDVVMPDMNGRDLADQATARRPDVKVLFTTGYTRNAIVHNGVLDPGVHILHKPATLEQMALKLRTVLDG